jgi:hypothetical protein
MKTGKHRKLQSVFSRLSIVLLFAAFFIFIYINSGKNNWDGKERFTFILHNTNVSPDSDRSLVVISLEPSRSKAVYLKIQPEVMLNMPYGYQKYILESVYKLGQLDGKRNSADILVKSIEGTLGIKIDGYMISDNSGIRFPSSKDEWQKFKREYLSLSGIPGLVSLFKGPSRLLETNISFLELFRIHKALRVLRIDQFEFIPLSEENALIRKILPDGSTVFEVDSDIFDSLTSGIFEDFKIREENVTLEVQNATGQEKVAYLYSRILKSMGSNVILTSTAKDVLNEKCIIYVNSVSQTKANITKKLMNQFGCLQKNKDFDDSQTDITVIFGELMVK